MRFVVDGNKFKLCYGLKTVTHVCFEVTEPDSVFNQKYLALTKLRTIIRHRNNGFATLLLGNVLNYAKYDLKIGYVILNVYKNNYKALNLYRRIGFEELKNFDLYYTLIYKL